MPVNSNDPLAKCWCSTESELIPFSSHYFKCLSCGTLVVKTEKDESSINQNIYNETYYLEHLVEDYGYPTLQHRARFDISERCLHWLRTLLKYKNPPANVLELGSAHGGFVYLLQSIGFNATGIEMNQWLADFAKKTFNTSLLVGAVETQKFERETFDVIAMMDVIEHFNDPLSTVRHCLSLLKPDGILMIQTPCLPESKNYAELKKESSSFLQQLKEKEHLNLFSKKSIRTFFQYLGCTDIQFEPAIFHQYDMFLVVGKRELKPDKTEPLGSLFRSPDKRLILALLDLKEQYDVVVLDRNNHYKKISELQDYIVALEKIPSVKVLKKIRKLIGR